MKCRLMKNNEWKVAFFRQICHRMIWLVVILALAFALGLLLYLGRSRHIDREQDRRLEEDLELLSARMEQLGRQNGQNNSD